MLPIERIKLAVGFAWADLKTDHPHQCMEAEEEFGTEWPDILMAELDKGSEYQALVARTDTETSIPALVSALKPLILAVTTTLLS